MENKKGGKKEEMEEILRRIESQSKDAKKEQIRKLFNNEKTRPIQKKITGTWRKELSNWWPEFQKLLLKYRRRIFADQNKHLFSLTAFLLFSTFICWKIEKKFDSMKSRSEPNKSLKQEQIEQEERYIQKMLAKSEFESIPITDLPQHQTYQYESDAAYEITTKEELLGKIIEDMEKGSDPPPGYQKDIEKIRSGSKFKSQSADARRDPI